MKKLGLFFVLMLVAMVSVVSAQGQATADGAKPSLLATEKVTTFATVLSVDMTTRVVTMRSEDGDTVVVPVKPEVKTLAQVKAGDRIKISYSDQYSVTVESGTKVETTHESMRGDAKEGENPSVSRMERTTYMATISALDQPKGTVTLKDESGEEFKITPLVPENIAKVAVGDVVVVRVTHSMAASVDKAPAKKTDAKKSAKK